MADKSDKTEKATPRKRKESRKEGQIAKSQDMYGWLAVLIGSFVIPAMMGSVGASLQGSVEDWRRVIARPEEAVMSEVARQTLLGVGGAITLFLVVAFGLGLLTQLAQVGFVVSGKPLKPQIKRLDPIQGFKRLFSVRTAWQAATGVVKMLAIGLVSIPMLVGVSREMVGGTQFDLSAGLALVGSSTLSAVRIAAVLGVVIALADYGFQRWKTEKDMRMSKQEVKQEMKNSDGDPHVKARQRSVRLAASRNRMIASVADADVVITNPTHVAVALRYEPGTGAPRVVARGADGIAVRIKATARDAEVPIVESRPLARALYASCDVDREIPRELFEGVAMVLAFVQRVARRSIVTAEHIYEVPVSWDPELSDLDSDAGRTRRRAARRRRRPVAS